MPIDSVSSASPAARQRVEAARAARANCARCARDVGGRLGDAHEAAQREPRQRGDRARQRQRLRGRDAALASPRR